MLGPEGGEPYPTQIPISFVTFSSQVLILCSDTVLLTKADGIYMISSLFVSSNLRKSSNEVCNALADV